MAGTMGWDRCGNALSRYGRQSSLVDVVDVVGEHASD